MLFVSSVFSASSSLPNNRQHSDLATAHQYVVAALLPHIGAPQLVRCAGRYKPYYLSHIFEKEIQWVSFLKR